MEFYSLENAPISDDDVVFREAWLGKLLALLAWTALAIAGGWFAWVFRSWWFALFPLLCFLLVLATLTSLRRALSWTNWLMRRQSTGLLIKYRSYMKAGSPEDEVVARIGYDELQSAGKTVQRRVQPEFNASHSSSVAAHNLTFLDLEMKQEDLEALKDKLRTERSRWAITRGRHAVTVNDPVIRLLWRSTDSRITPPVESALEAISATGQVRIRPET
jgi:hypothetical protein